MCWSKPGGSSLAPYYKRILDIHSSKSLPSFRTSWMIDDTLQRCKSKMSHLGGWSPQTSNHLKCLGMNSSCQQEGVYIIPEIYMSLA